MMKPQVPMREYTLCTFVRSYNLAQDSPGFNAKNEYIGNFDIFFASIGHPGRGALCGEGILHALDSRHIAVVKYVSRECKTRERHGELPAGQEEEGCKLSHKSAD